MIIIEHHPHIHANDFDALRAHYRDYLYSKNFDVQFVHEYLDEFDFARYSEKFDTIYDIVTSIGVILI